MTDSSKLPPLPEPRLETNGDVFGHENVEGFTAEQMRAYGLSCYEAGREAAAKVAAECANRRRESMTLTFGISEATELKIAQARQCEEIAAAIRKA